MVPSISPTAGNTLVTVSPLPPPPAQPAAVDTLLTPRTAAALRDRTNIAGTCKQDMRALLGRISASQPLVPTQLVHEIPDDVPWRHYIARQKECQQIVGSGIVQAYLEFLPEIRDPNRGRQFRLDFVFVNVERVRTQLHPGATRRKDAKPIYTTV